MFNYQGFYKLACYCLMVILHFNQMWGSKIQCQRTNAEEHRCTDHLYPPEMRDMIINKTKHNRALAICYGIYCKYEAWLQAWISIYICYKVWDEIICWSRWTACVTLWRQLQTRFWDASPRASVQKQQPMVFPFFHRVFTNYCWFFLYDSMNE